MISRIFSTEPHPWFVPLHRRVITMAICVFWLVIELIGQQSVWLIIAGAVNGYAIWEFFLGPNYRNGSKPAPPDAETDPDADPGPDPNP